MAKKMNNISYDEYRKHMQKLSFEKKKLNEKLKKLKAVRKQYNNYLNNNPYRTEYWKLAEEVEKLREEIIKMIPNWK